MMNYVGQQVGHYRLERLLGKGGFAHVYLGVHIDLNTPAAVKVLTQLTSSDIEQFRKEAQTIARLVHPNIVRVFDFGVENGLLPYLVMDFMPGGTLCSRHSKSEKLPLSTVVSYTSQVAQALQYAHYKGFIHRDINPENMLVGRNSEILLSDFGITVNAHSTRSLSMQAKAGTLAYIAPEQIEGYPRPASDQYSLGITVYEWICGERPFKGTSLYELIHKHGTVPPPPLRGYVPDLSPDVEYVVLKALAKNWKARFNTVKEFVHALEQASTVTFVRPAIAVLPMAYPAPPVKLVPTGLTGAEPDAPLRPIMAVPHISTAPEQSFTQARPNTTGQGALPTPPLRHPALNIDPYGTPIYDTPPPPASVLSSSPVYRVSNQVSGAFNPYMPSAYQPNLTPISHYAPSPPRPITHLPIIRGMSVLQQWLFMLGYELLLAFFLVPIIFGYLTGIGGAYTWSPLTIYLLTFSVFLLPAGISLAGSLFGSWRGGLVVAFYECLFFLTSHISTSAMAPSQSSASSSPFSIVVFVCSWPLAAFVTGLIYQHRIFRGFKIAFGTLLPGIVIYLLGYVMISPTTFSSGLAFATLSCMVPILAGILALPIAHIEVIIQRSIEVAKGRHVHKSWVA